MPSESRRTLLKLAALAPLARTLAAAPLELSGRAGAGQRVAVVGAGAFGGWTALHLQRSGAQVTFLLARQACDEVCRAFLREGGTYAHAHVEPGAFHSGKMGPLALSDGRRLEADAYVFACGPWLGRVFPAAIGERVQASR